MPIRRWNVLILTVAMVALLIAGCADTEGGTPDVQPTATATESLSGPSVTAPVPIPSPRATAEEIDLVEVALEQVRRFEGATLAKVNGEGITWEDYEPALVQSLTSVTRENKLHWDDPAMQQRMADFQMDILEQVIDQRLLQQMAADEGIAVSEEQAQERLDTLRSTLEASGQSGAWESYLEGLGLTEEQFGSMLRDQLLMEAILERMDIGEEEQAHLFWILVSDEALAKAVVSELEAGRSFAELAELYSEDAESKASGGEIGWFARGTMPPEIEELAFSLSPGQFGGPIELEEGYAIILVEERALRELDENALRQKQFEALMLQVQDLRAQAEIEYLVDFGQD
jgi:parvulin-like peptidyl-prolyl isomerase